MANDFFSGIMKGLSGFMPADDPQTKVFTATNELNELQQQEDCIYAKLGKRLFPSICNSAEHSDLVEELRVVSKKLEEAKEALKSAQAAETAAKQEQAQCVCPSCGSENPPGTKFCQGCGTKLGTAALICPACGAQNKAETRFCGECGAKLSEN